MTNKVNLLWDVESILIQETYPHHMYVKTIQTVKPDFTTNKQLISSSSTNYTVLKSYMKHAGIQEQLYDALLSRLNSIYLQNIIIDNNFLTPHKSSISAIATASAYGYNNTLISRDTEDTVKIKLLSAGYRLHEFNWRNSIFSNRHTTVQELITMRNPSQHTILITSSKQMIQASQKINMTHIKLDTPDYNFETIMQMLNRLQVK